MENRFPTTPRLVRDVMTVGVMTCTPDTAITDLARWMLEKGLEAVVVLNPEDGHALGVVGQDELVKAYTREDAATLKVEDVMREGVPQVPPDIPLEAAAKLMQDMGVRSLFLMHHAGGIEYPAAIISYSHLIRHLAARNDEELRDLGISAARQSPLEAFIARREAARGKFGKKS